jgi:hypothetical protein
MTISPLAGHPVPKEMLVDPDKLEREYYENLFKIYAESFKDQAHLDLIVSEAHAIVSEALQPMVVR